MRNLLQCLLTAGCLNLPAKAAVTLNQVETFSGIHGWMSGFSNQNPPVIDVNGGPLGPGDPALRVTANGGNDAGGKLIVFNQTLWTGDYTTAGIFSMSVDLRNMGTTSLSMRLAFNGPGGWFVTPAATVSAFSGWSGQVFDIRPAALVAADGDNAVATMTGVTQMRILHSGLVDYHGAIVSSAFMVDNLRALPEPSSAMITGMGGLLLVRRRRRS